MQEIAFLVYTDILAHNLLYDELQYLQLKLKVTARKNKTKDQPNSEDHTV